MWFSGKIRLGRCFPQAPTICGLCERFETTTTLTGLLTLVTYKSPSQKLTFSCLLTAIYKARINIYCVSDEGYFWNSLQSLVEGVGRKEGRKEGGMIPQVFQQCTETSVQIHESDKCCNWFNEMWIMGIFQAIRLACGMFRHSCCWLQGPTKHSWVSAPWLYTHLCSSVWFLWNNSQQDRVYCFLFV
jgi:hypothetical protein